MVDEEAGENDARGANGLGPHSLRTLRAAEKMPQARIGHPGMQVPSKKLLPLVLPGSLTIVPSFILAAGSSLSAQQKLPLNRFGADETSAETAASVKT